MDITRFVKQFEWDEYNSAKNWKKHRVAINECEEIFLNEALLIAEVDKTKIEVKEDRYLAYGVTNQGRALFVVFTVRSGRIRVISARDMSRHERRFYEQEAEKSN